MLQGKNTTLCFPPACIVASAAFRMLHIFTTSSISLGYKENQKPLSMLFALSTSDQACCCILCSNNIFLCPWFCFPAPVYAFQLSSLVLQSLIAQPRSGLFDSFWFEAFSVIPSCSLAVLSQPLMAKQSALLSEAKCPQVFSYMEKIKKKLIFMWETDAFSNCKAAWA